MTGKRIKFARPEHAILCKTRKEPSAVILLSGIEEREQLLEKLHASEARTAASKFGYRAIVRRRDHPMTPS
ncbi:hypothetical protein V6N13_146653 [Hibiscus sabdariffa]